MKDIQKIKILIEELLKLMKVSFDSIDLMENEGSTPKFVVKTPDSAILIGVKGANLFAFNHVVKKILSKGNEDETETKFFIDVNNYQQKSEEELKNKAKVMSDRARSFKVDIEMDPMSSYERMIVHSSLQGIPDIKTESKGEGKMRRVVIKYVEGGEKEI
jgi:spoIIIJ-associated protein